MATSSSFYRVRASASAKKELVVAVFDLTLPQNHVANDHRATGERRAIKTLLRP
jgi:hypothetical protein